MTDEKLLERARAGEEAAFLALYERHRAPVFRFAYRMLGSASLAEDVTHDCFLGLIKRPEGFDPSRAALRTYLYAAARNLANKQFRHYGDDTAVEDLASEPRQPDRDGPLSRLLDKELSGEVRKAIAALPPLQREALILFEYEELTLSEIASVVGADTGTVKSRLSRARERLRRDLSAYLKSAGGMIAVEKVYR